MEERKGGSREDFGIERKREREQTLENEHKGESARCKKERELRIGEERREKEMH